MVLTTRPYIFAALAVLLLLNACKPVKKDPRDYYPRLKMTAVKPQPNGSVVVEGKLESKGGANLGFYGFCGDTVTKPSMTSMQVTSGNLSGSVFSYTYTPTYGFHPAKRYYFRAWATNDYGYGMSDTMSAASLAFDTSTIDCHPIYNYLDMESTTAADIFQPFHSSIPSMTYTGSDYQVSISTSAHNLKLIFHASPVSGKYNSSLVEIRVDNRGAHTVGDVYVVQKGTMLEISICSAGVQIPINIFGELADYSLAAKFQCYK